MKQRKPAGTKAAEVGLVVLLDQLEQALAERPARTSVCKALSELNRQLGSVDPKPAARSGRLASPRRRRLAIVDSGGLFS